MAKKKRRGRPRGSKNRKKSTTRKGSGLSSFSFSDLQAEMDRRRNTLESRRDELVAELNEIEKELGESSTGRKAVKKKYTGKKRGPKPGSKRKKTAKKTSRKKTTRKKRTPRKGSLVSTLQEVLDGKTMTVSDATEAIQKSGYKSKSPNLRMMVNQQLLKHKDKFRKVSRGKYTAKK